MWTDVYVYQEVKTQELEKNVSLSFELWSIVIGGKQINGVFCLFLWLYQIDI